jgi:DNA excision repair protein ERCC-2
MPVRIDGERLVVELAVADLLDVALQRSLGFANRGGYERLWLGQAIHGRYQETALAADATYRREVVLAHSFDHRGWRVTIHGRADGLRRDGDAVVVEEIKSVRRDAQLSAPVRKLYEQQAGLYAWMLHRQQELPVRAELVLIEIGSDVLDREPVELDLVAVELAVRRRLDELVRSWELEREAQAGRRGAGSRLVFPYPTRRPGQEAIIEAVDRSLEQGDHLLIEAPTGIGKTVAALYPALRQALQQDRRLYVLTAKTLQQEMATTVLELLNRENAFHSLRVRAKAKMCANDEVLCHEEYCPYARDYYAKTAASRIVPRLLEDAGTLLPDRIFEVAREHEVCPFEISIELAHKAQVVVCDYNYAFDPYVALSDFAADNDLSDVVLVIDEIHNLLDRGRGYYSPTLSAGRARAAAATMTGGEPVYQRVAQGCLRLADLIEEHVEAALLDAAGGAVALEARLPEDELLALRADFDAAFIDLLEHRRATSSFRADDPFVDLNCLLLADDPAFAQYVERTFDDRRLSILCLDPSRFLGALINRTHATVGLSATLSPVEFYRDLLGFDRERFSHLSLPSPFPIENRRLVIDDGVATTFRERPDNYGPIAARLARLAEQVPGNCLALFPSYEFLDQVGRRLRVKGKHVLVQARNASDRDREAILEALRRSPLAGDSLLLAVAGGVFAEGVDYPGEMLRAVAVIGPCLPALTLERQLLKRYYDDQFQRGFEYAFVVPGMTRVVQAAGRLIRSAEDVGVVALLDRRFLQSPYRDFLPLDWIDGGTPEDLVGSPGEVAELFFKALARV